VAGPIEPARTAAGRRDSLNFGFNIICNEVKDLLFAAPPQIERIFERSRRRFQSNQNGAAATNSGRAAGWE
jgi:hypothetical protein